MQIIWGHGGSCLTTFCHNKDDPFFNPVWDWHYHAVYLQQHVMSTTEETG